MEGQERKERCSVVCFRSGVSKTLRDSHTTKGRETVEMEGLRAFLPDPLLCEFQTRKVMQKFNILLPSQEEALRNGVAQIDTR